MKETLNSRKTKPSFEINWKIRENFSEAALNSFFDEIYNQNFLIENNK